MDALNKLKSWMMKKHGKSKKVENGELTYAEASASEEKAEDEVEPPEEVYAQEQILIKFRAKPGGDVMDVNHEFTHIPTEEEIKEEFGPGLYNIFLQEEEGKRPKIKKRYNIEGHPILPVDTYEIKLRVAEGGQLLDTNVEFPGPTPPEKDEIINSLGGGGFVKLNAKNKDGKIIWSEWYDFTDVEPSEFYKRRDSSFKSRLEKELELRKKQIEDEALGVLEQIGGGKKKDKFDTAVNNLIETLEDKKLEKLEEAIERFGEKISNPGMSKGDREKKGLTDIAFREPYLMKLQTQKEIIANMAKSDPEAAMKALEKMPDGVTIGLNLASAATGLVEAFTDYMKEQSRTMRRGEGGEKQREEKKETHMDREREKEEKAEVEKMREQLERESAIEMYEQRNGEGFELTFDIGEERGNE